MLADGDLLSVDCGAIVEGWHGDAAVTLAVGTVAPADLALSAACREALDAGIAAVRPGARLTDVSHAVQAAAEAAGRRDGVAYGIVEEYGGHGIGTSMHMDPFLPNHGAPGHGPRLRRGMALAVEPMLTGGDAETARARRRLDGRHGGRQPGGALGALGGGDRRRAADPHPPGRLIAPVVPRAPGALG